jgi:F-type H+-transporting ATPase subunit delta
VTSRTAAIRYARALFDVGLKEGLDLNALESELAGFAGLFPQHPQLEAVLLNPAVPVPRKRAAVVELTKALALSAPIGKLAILLAERDRLGLVPDLLAAYRQRLMDHQNVVRAAVTTAEPLSEGRATQVQQALAKATGRTVTLSTAVDPSIIGGLVARVGGTVYDASVTNQLRRMKERLAANV